MNKISIIFANNMRRIVFALILISIVFLNSCKILYPGMMFQQKDYQVFELKEKLIEEYIMKPGDELLVDFYTRDGQSLIEKHVNSDNQTSNNSVSATIPYQYRYIIKPNGYVSLPIIGEYYAQGYNAFNLKKALEAELSRLYVDPFVVVNVTNRRVFLFKGYTGSVVPLNQTPTHLIEVLALSGGVERDLKAYKIKIIRGDLKNPTVYNIDLSTINGLITSDIILQSNDIVYMEPRRRIFTDSLREVTTIVSLLTSLITTVVLITQLKK